MFLTFGIGHDWPFSTRRTENWLKNRHAFQARAKKSLQLTPRVPGLDTFGGLNHFRILEVHSAGVFVCPIHSESELLGRSQFDAENSSI